MVHIDLGNDDLGDVRRFVMKTRKRQEVRKMLAAASLAAFGIVAVTATMMTTLF
jgi:hypothetical protein